MMLLEEANGQVDLAVLRRLMSDHFEDCVDAVDPSKTSVMVGRAEKLTTLCRHAATPSGLRTAASLITQCGPDKVLPIAWYCFGSPCAGVYFPLLLVGELPPALQTPSPLAGSRSGGWLRRWQPDSPREEAALAVPRAILAGLQERFDQETTEFVAEVRELCQRGESNEVPRLAELFMQHNLECWENICSEFTPAPTRGRRVPAESEFHSSGAWS